MLAQCLLAIFDWSIQFLWSRACLRASKTYSDHTRRANVSRRAAGATRKPRPHSDYGRTAAKPVLFDSSPNIGEDENMSAEEKAEAQALDSLMAPTRDISAARTWKFRPPAESVV